MHTFQVHGERLTSRWCCWRHSLGAVVESGWGHGGHSHTGMTGFLRTDSLSSLWGDRKRCSLWSKEEAEHQKWRCSDSWPWTCGLQTKKINACCFRYLDCGISLQKPRKRLHMMAFLTAVSKASPHCSPNDKESERLWRALFSQIYRLKQNILGNLLIQSGLSFPRKTEIVYHTFLQIPALYHKGVNSYCKTLDSQTLNLHTYARFSS